jgi:hypothetical protein
MPRGRALQRRSPLTLIPVVLIIIVTLIDPLDIVENSKAIDVDDGTLFDWTDVPLTLYDEFGDVPPGNAMTDLILVAFDYDEIWLYVRWDLYDNLTYKSGILYDMGINLTGTGSTWDIFVSAELDLIGGVPELVNISIRDADDNHVWNASDDGNMTEDGSLYLDPTPGLSPGNLSVEARFPLFYIGITTGVIFGQFRSHSSPSVNSAVKDQIPESGYIILIVDNDPPQLINLDITPSIQENGQPVNISVNATDDFGIGSIWVNITRPDGSWINVSMENGSTDSWYFEDIFNDPGDYTVVIWSNDTNDNWDTLGPDSFTIVDTDGPHIDNVLAWPNPQENGDYVTIAADVTDDIQVDSVWIEIIHPDSSSINISMEKGSGDEWYLDAQYIELGVHSFTIWANDTHDNWNHSGPYTFTIVDTDGPQIDNIQATPDPQENGGSVNITADVTDDIGVDSVWIEIVYPDSSTSNISMEKGPGDEWFFEADHEELGVFTYTIRAYDTQDNWEHDGPNTFEIVDTDPPEFSDPLGSPDPQDMGEPIKISVNVIDDVGVSEVWIQIRHLNGTWLDYPMTQGSNDEWEFTMQFEDPGIYAYTISANDTQDNWNATNLFGFTIVDTESPKIEDPKVDPHPQIDDSYVNITVNITDNVEIINVWINITAPNGTWINDTMNPGDEDLWYYNTTFVKEGNYTYTIWVEDAGGNTNSTISEYFTIVPYTPEDKPPLPLPNPLPPPGIPKALYMSVLLIFWPLLLILFTVLFERKYGFGNRARKEIEPIMAGYLESKYEGNDPEYGLDRILSTSQNAAIPVEEFMVAALTMAQPSHFQDQFADQLMDDFRKITDR